MKITKLLIATISIISFYACSKGQSEAKDNQNKINEAKDESITIGHKLKFESDILGEDKELYISLPSKYDEHVQHYPVIFTFEAEFLFEPTQTVAKYMAARSKMPESIIVGIANGQFKKRHEASYKRWGGIPDKYIQFFDEELIPYIEENYRANSHRTIVGLSPSTGFLYEAFLTQPDLFKGYIALSAHLEWDREVGTKVIDEIMAKNNNPDQPKSIFYLGRAASDFPIFKGSEEAFKNAFEKLESYTPDKVKVKIDVIEDEEHYLMSLAGIRSGLEAIYPNDLWRNPGFAGWNKSANYAESYYKAYYDKLSSIYGFDIYPKENAHGHGFSYTGRIRSAWRWGTTEQVKQLALLGIEYFPNSAHMHMTLAEVYKKERQQELAVKHGEKSLELAAKFHSSDLNEYRERRVALQ